VQARSFVRTVQGASGAGVGIASSGCRVLNVGASRAKIRMILENKNEIQTLRF
jgi:hypothetical protein